MQQRKRIPIEEAIIKIRTYCNYRDRCHKEVREKLYSMGLYKREVDQVMLQMMDEDLLNEERFARSFARGYFRTKQWGKFKIKGELMRRQIHPSLVTRAMEEIDEEAYRSTIQSLIAKKARMLPATSKQETHQKIANYLLSKGYQYAEFKSLLAEFVR